MVGVSAPQLITLEQHQGDWDAYLVEIHKKYMQYVVNGKLSLKGLPIRFKHHPAHNKMGYSFWHAISEGPIEADRIPDLRRCERIHWIPWVINNIKDEIEHFITWWEAKRKSESTIVLFFEEENYVVILARRRDYYLFKTAFCVSPRRKRGLIKERADYWQSKKTKGAG
jgi:hypothetical protein